MDRWIYIYIQIDGQMDRQMDRWIDGWMDRQIDRWKDGWLDRQMDRWMDRLMDRQKDRQMDRWIDGWMDRQIDRQIDRQMQQIERYRQAERQTYKQAGKIRLGWNIYLEQLWAEQSIVEYIRLQQSGQIGLQNRQLRIEQQG